MSPAYSGSCPDLPEELSRESPGRRCGQMPEPPGTPLLDPQLKQILELINLVIAFPWTQYGCKTLVFVNVK